MMNSNIHRTEPSHGEAANRSVASCGDRAILLIDKAHQVQSHEVFHELLLIKAVPPLAGFPTPSIPIRKNHDQFRYLSMPDEGISKLDRFATADPVVLAPWRTMKQVEKRRHALRCRTFSPAVDWFFAWLDLGRACQISCASCQMGSSSTSPSAIPMAA